MASQDSLGDEAEQFSLACEVSLLQSVVKQEGEDVAAAMHEALLESQRDKVSGRAAGTSDARTQERETKFASRKSAHVKTEASDDDVIFMGSKRKMPIKDRSVPEEVRAAKQTDRYVDLDSDEEQPVVPAPAKNSSVLSMLRPLDAQQAKAVAAVTQGLNVVIVGGAGSGKTHTTAEVVKSLDVSKVVSLLASNWQSLKVAQSKLTSSIVDGARIARIRFMTVNKGAGVNRDDAWKVEEIEAQRDAMGRRGLDDAASSDVVIIEEAGQIHVAHLTVLFRTLERVRGQTTALPKDIPVVKVLVGDLQTKPIGDVAGEGTWFFESDQVDESFVVVPLVGNRRLREGDDPRVLDMLHCIKIRRDCDFVREFFAVAEKVDLKPFERQVLHLFWSNDDAARFALSDLKRMYGKEVRVDRVDGQRAFGYDIRLAFGSRFVFELALVPGVKYLYSAGESIVSVGNTVLRNKDVLVCVATSDDSGDPVFSTAGGVEFVLRRVKFRCEYPEKSGQFHELHAYPVKYNNYAPVFSKQGSEADYVHVHCEKLRGDNVLYTAVTRCRGSPFTGHLKLSKLYLHQCRPNKDAEGNLVWGNSRVHGEEALNMKWTTCPKSVVFQSIVFGDVPDDVYAENLARIPDTPHWRGVMAKLRRMRVMR